jgi:hypothetical protein
MKNTLLACAILACGLASPAMCQTLGEEGSFQFRTPAERSVALSVAQTIEAKQGGQYEAGFGGFGAGGAGSGAGGSAANTNNLFQFIDQSSITNNCTSSGAVGSTMSCGGGGTNSVSGTNLTSSGNSNKSDTTLTGNTVTNANNTANNTLNRGDGNNNTSTTTTTNTGGR